METRKFDTLSEFHLKKIPESRVYALVALLICALEEEIPHNQSQIANQISEILGDRESKRILELLCLKFGVDYSKFIQECHELYGGHASARMLLHIAILSLSFVCGVLQIDEDEASQLLDHFRHTFTIDSPLSWLKAMLHQSEKQRLYVRQAKELLMLGRESVGQPVDTAEERKLKHRRLHPSSIP